MGVTNLFALASENKVGRPSAIPFGYPAKTKKRPLFRKPLPLRKGLAISCQTESRTRKGKALAGTRVSFFSALACTGFRLAEKDARCLAYAGETEKETRCLASEGPPNGMEGFFVSEGLDDVGQRNLSPKPHHGSPPLQGELPWRGMLGVWEGLFRVADAADGEAKIFEALCILGGCAHCCSLR